MAGADGLFTLQNFQTGKRGRRAKLVARVAVSVKERFEFMILTEEGIEDFLRGECRRHRQITAGQPLGQTKEVRLHIFMVAGKKRRTGVAPVSDFLLRLSGGLF